MVKEVYLITIGFICEQLKYFKNLIRLKNKLIHPKLE